MNYVETKVIGNTKNIYIPIMDGKDVSFSDNSEIEQALGLKDIEVVKKNLDEY